MTFAKYIFQCTVLIHMKNIYKTLERNLDSFGIEHLNVIK